MKRRLVILLSPILVFLFLSSRYSFAQEEEEVGFVKKTWRNLSGLFKKSDEKKEQSEKVLAPQEKIKSRPPVEQKPAKTAPGVEGKHIYTSVSEDEMEFESEEEPPPLREPKITGEGTTTAARSPYDDITEKEIRDRIRRFVEITPDIPGYVPGLKVTRDEEKKVVKIEYDIDNVLKDIETLDKKILIELHGLVTSARTIIQTQRLQRQLEMIRATQERGTQKPPVIYMPPKVPTPPPSAPRVPPAPPQAPKVPTPPPLPQPRR